MRDLVSDCVEDVLLLVASEVLVTGDIVVVVGDAADVLHGAHGVVRAKDRIKFVERIRRVEKFLIIANRGLGDAEEIIRHLLRVLGQRLATVDTHWEMRKLLLKLLARLQEIEGTSDDAEEICGNLFRTRKIVHFDGRVSKRGQDGGVHGDTCTRHDALKLLVVLGGLARLSHGEPLTVSDDLPVIGSDNARLIGRLEVGLVKAGEYNVTIIRLKLSVDVLGLICLILKMLEALTVRHEEGLELDDTLVLPDNLVSHRDVNAMILPHVWSVLGKFLAIDNNGAECLALVINEETL